MCLYVRRANKVDLNLNSSMTGMTGDGEGAGTCPVWGWGEGSRIHSVILRYPAALPITFGPLRSTAVCLDTAAPC